MRRSWGEMKRILPGAIGVLALAGLVDSAYLTAVHFEVAGMGLPEVCRIGADSCEAVLGSQQAVLAGIPTPLLGAVYFAFVLGAAFVRITAGRWFAPWLLTAILVAGLGLSGYLMHSLVVDMDSLCPFCVVAHAINTAVFVLFWVSLHEDGVTLHAAQALRERLRSRGEHSRG